MTVAALAKAARRLREDDDEDLAELAAGFERFLAGDCTDLYEALGIKIEPGQRSAQTRAMLSKRDELLRRLAADHFPDLTPNAAATEMHKAWSRYYAAAWPRERNSEAIPVFRVNRPEFGFWQIMRAQDCLLSQRTIRQILAAS